MMTLCQTSDDGANAAGERASCQREADKPVSLVEPKPIEVHSQDVKVVRIAIHGAAGRMGRRLVALGVADPQVHILAAVASPRHPELGQDAGILAGVNQLGIPLAESLGDATPQAVIDFSVPVAAEALTAICVTRRIPLVMGTTGLSANQLHILRDAAGTIPVVWSPSMSTTVNLGMKLAEKAAQILKESAGGVDVEIIERHHRMKTDAPSGTALRFGEIVAAGMGQTVHRHGREGQVGQRPANEIGYHAIRAGDNPGENTIIFGLLGETLELTVKASSRDCYALGALAAAKFVAGQKPGLYTMFDVLGLG
jgi:4-hydroxy-tetrahydrodipicolinate reductase